MYYSPENACASDVSQLHDQSNLPKIVVPRLKIYTATTNSEALIAIS